MTPEIASAGLASVEVVEGQFMVNDQYDATAARVVARFGIGMSPGLAQPSWAKRTLGRSAKGLNSPQTAASTYASGVRSS
jgi:hypothetical protein